MKVFFADESAPVSEMAQYQVLMAKETEDMILDQKTVERGIETALKDPSKGRYLIVKEDKKLIGMLMIMSEWSDWRCKEVLWIQSVYIVPEKRGEGVYKKMYQYLQDLVRENENYAGIRLYVDKTNTKAQKVYTKLGMIKEHYDLYEWMEER